MLSDLYVGLGCKWLQSPDCKGFTTCKAALQGSPVLHRLVSTSASARSLQANQCSSHTPKLQQKMCVLNTVATVHVSVWSVSRPKLLPFCMHTSAAAQHLSMSQVACTALGVNHCLLKGRTFDMCIVDEAGQMTLPVALGPILHSRYGAVS